jgi:hypothetical protein
VRVPGAGANGNIIALQTAAEAQSVTEFVREKRFEVVGFRVGRERRGRSEGDQRIAGIEVDIRIENLANFRGGAPLPS